MQIIVRKQLKSEFMNYKTKAKILIDEALPYLQKFKNKIMVIKYGGNAMINNELKNSVMKDIAFLKTVGIKPVVIHGGGQEITKEMEKLGTKPIFINGLRVTNKSAIKIIKKVFANINTEIQNNLKKHHVLAKCVYNCMCVIQKNKELGFVGEIKSVNTKKIMHVLAEDKIPVISPLGTMNGQIYNINADIAAMKIAVGLHAVKLTILTNVDGVIEAGKLISHLSIKDARIHISNGVITSGMIPKVEACIEAVQLGCQKAHLINGTVPHSLLFEIFTEKGIGTEVVTNGN